MTHYIGIDLGTTNSAITSFDGEKVQSYRSPENHAVTPSVIYYDRRGGRYAGARAYNQLALAPESCAKVFKRFMGTSTPIQIPGAGLTLTPEQCSSEILKTLYGYLPEDIRNSADGGTVITVPAAFNGMQKDATLSAAEAAGIGRVALMQEPVAAVMAVMRARATDGIFLIYDFGGGTLDVAIAQSIGGRVNLLDNGGVAMCGGSDFDRAVLDNVVKPWLVANFQLPENFVTDPKYSRLLRIATFASEKAKVELSSRSEALVTEGEETIRTVDLAGQDIYLSVPITRDAYNKLIEPKLQESFSATRDVIHRAKLQPGDIERIVFVGGPTQYGPMRERVAFEMGIPGTTEVDPMTAVAEGAAVFAESIDWSTATRSRKSSRGTISSNTAVGVTFNFVARTPGISAKAVAIVEGTPLEGSTFQIDSLDSGWSSGKMTLANGAAVTLPLSKHGDNRFKIFLFDPSGGPLSLGQSTITITKTAATVDAIPASHSIGVTVRKSQGGGIALDFLVAAGDPLPAKGQKRFRAEESVKAGGTGELRIALWEGEIQEPYTDNRPIGCIKITGSDFEQGVIASGAELICDYEISDAGTISMSITVPSVGATINPGHNFYSRQDSNVDFTDAGEMIKNETTSLQSRIDTMSESISDPMLDQARAKVAEVHAAAESQDPAVAKEAHDKLLEAKVLLSKARAANLAQVRAKELANLVSAFDAIVREFATPSEITAFERMGKAAQNCMRASTEEFERHIDEMRSTAWRVLWRQDHFVIDTFKERAAQGYMAGDKQLHEQLVAHGEAALQKGDITELRAVAQHLRTNFVYAADGDELLASVNILRG